MTKEYTVAEARHEYGDDDTLWNSDVFGFYDDEIAHGAKPEDFRFLETTFSYLANLKVGTQCGAVNNTCFVGMAKELPHTKIRCLLDLRENNITSPMIYIEKRWEAVRIQDVCDEHEGSLREEFMDAGWNYFETE